ncbi:MAG: acetate--CoA ligase family protein [Anaerolineae bacterium]|nr:acetate--CoA ligase family protein [Anaerolineae bacterium]
MPDQLSYFFNPRGVAVIGASSNPAKLSYGVVKNLKSHGYQGAIYPINPKGGDILGLKVYPTIADVPDPIDLAVIMVRAQLVPDALRECGKRGLKVAIVVTGGFREAGEEGASLESSLKGIAETYGMRIIGPNCVGVMDTHAPLDTTFITQMPKPGHMGFASHSGAIVGGAIDWAIEMGVGYSRILSLGNQVDVSISDGVNMLNDDPHTHVISLYAEGIPNGPRFVETAAAIYRDKPIVMVKAGRTAAGARAVASHTGALAGAGRAYEAACHRAGVLMVNSLQEQNDVAMALATQPLPQGRRVVLVTNAGGPAALASDQLDELGLTLADLSPETIARLGAVTPHDAQLSNPVDMLGGPQAEMYYDALKVALEDKGVDMAMALFVPQAITPVNDVARNVVKVAQETGKPVVCCLVGGMSIPEAIHILNENGVPFYQDPNRAARALAGLWQYAELQRRSDLTPTPVPGVDRERARRILRAAWKTRGEGFIDAEIAAQVAAAYGARVPFSGIAANVEEAVLLAQQAGYPVVAKLIAPGVVHKADVGGIALNLQDAEAVRAATERMIGGDADRSVMIQQMAPQGQEVILGAQRDPQFGPLLMFGMGGIYVEVFKDVAFRLAPLCETDARDMILETAAGKLLQGVRGQVPGDMEAVIDTLRRIGQLVADFPCIRELDINPLIVGPAGHGAWAVDVRMALSEQPE